MPTACHTPDQKILMFDGSIRRADCIKVGDVLMGPDSTGRVVLDVHSGEAEMVTVMPKKPRWAPFTVTKDHVLSLVSTTSSRSYLPSRRGGVVSDVSIQDYTSSSEWFKHTHKLFRVGVDFQDNVEPLPVPPYVLGVILGDGSLSVGDRVGVTTRDDEILAELSEFAESFGLSLSLSDSCGSRTPTYFFRGVRGKRNTLLEAIRGLGLTPIRCEDRFIPNVYKVASRENRLNLLAGLLDSDGSISSGYPQHYDFISKSKRLAEDLVFLASSLGFYSVLAPRECSGFGVTRVYYRVYISCGGQSPPPCKVARKIASHPRSRKNPLRTGFTVIPAGIGPYSGFTVSGDGRYVLGDFTVTHNSGKTVVAAAILKALNLPSIFLVNSIRLLRQTAQSFEKFGLRNVGVVGEGVFEPGYTTVAMVQTLNAAIKRRKSKAIHLLETADVLFADEMHHISSKSWENVALTTGAAIRYGLSGTPFRTRGLSRYEDWLVFGLCGEICYSIPTQMLVDRGYIARPRLFMLPVSEPRVNSFKDWHSVYDLGVVNHEGRNAAAKDVISRLLGRGLRVLVLVQRIEHGKAMIQDLHESGVSSVFLMGSDKIFRQGENGPVEDMDEVVDFTSKTVEDFRSGKYQVLIASPVLDEGIDLPEIEALVILSGGKSLIKIIQRLGRALRPKPGENEVFVVDFYDKHHPWLTSHSKKRYGEYTEEGHTVLHADDFDRAFPPMNGGTDDNAEQPWDSLLA